MATYTLRDKHGTMKAKFSSTLAREVIEGASGFFREASYVIEGKLTVFEITKGSKLEVGGLSVYLWSGDLLVPEKG